MTEILFLSYDKNDACSWYRSAGIAADLRKQSGLSITSVSWKDIDLDWSTILQFDIVMIQRPYTRQSLDLCRYVKALNVALWIDYDDNLFAVPIENKAYHIYNNQANQGNIKGILNLADVVSVTTEDLKAAYLPFNSNIQVIPNAFNDSVFKREQWSERSKLAVWRGTDTHILDVWSYAQAISQATEEHPDWQFLFWGFEPYMLSTTENKGFKEGQDIILYHSNLQRMKPAVMQIPLQDNVFNRCKSIVSVIEGSYAGAVSIIPDFWDVPGTLKYNSNETYYQALNAVLSGQIDIKTENAKSWEYIQDCLTLSRVNKMRVELIKTLL